jgi:translation elongation factor P/translation initiation factor 5A
MKVSEIEKNTKVNVGGSVGKVTAVNVVKTGQKGRPAKAFDVKFSDGTVLTYRAKDLKPAQASA